MYTRVKENMNSNYIALLITIRFLIPWISPGASFVHYLLLPATWRTRLSRQSFRSDFFMTQGAAPDNRRRRRRRRPRPSLCNSVVSPHAVRAYIRYLCARFFFSSSFLIGRTREINRLWAMGFGNGSSRNRRNRDRGQKQLCRARWS